MSAKVKISYEKPEELKQIVAMLSPVMRDNKSLYRAAEYVIIGAEVPRLYGTEP